VCDFALTREITHNSFPGSSSSLVLFGLSQSETQLSSLGIVATLPTPSATRFDSENSENNETQRAQRWQREAR